jgi:hypothetical protein
MFSGSRVGCVILSVGCLALAAHVRALEATRGAPWPWVAGIFTSDALAPTPTTPTPLEIYDVEDILAAPAGSPTSSSARFTPDELVVVVRDVIGDWPDDTSLEVHRGHLVVCQTPAAHTRLAAHLRGLRRALR